MLHPVSLLLVQNVDVSSLFVNEVATQPRSGYPPFCR